MRGNHDKLHVTMFQILKGKSWWGWKTAKISSLKSRDADKYECPVDEVLYVDRKKLNAILWVIYVMNRQR